MVARKVEGYQRPNGGERRPQKGEAWVIAAPHLRVFSDGISESNHPRSIIGPSAVRIEAAERVVADIQRRQRLVGAEAIRKFLRKA